MEIRVLGPVEVFRHGDLVDIGHARQRAVLAILAVRVGRVITIAQLVDELWPDGPPRSARETLYSYVSRLRKILAGSGVSIDRRPGGYLLDVEPDIVDIVRFRQAVMRARASGAVADWDAALGLWGGEPFAGLDVPVLDRLRTTLDAERFAAMLDRADALLEHGEHARLLPELRDLCERHPRDERLAAQLMLALYRCGCVSEAQDHYLRFRRRTVADRGMEPGPRLAALHRRILDGDPDLAPGSDSDTDALNGSTQPVVPRQLPGAPPGFTGRGDMVRRLDELAMEGHRTILISGTPGVGKTTLAVHWSNEARQDFPDGQLYVNLRGFDPSGQPMSVVEAARGFLDALGVPTQRVPSGEEEQIAMYRSLVAERRLLVVLDNAADAEQVRPLLPGGDGCLAVVTSRNQLTGLVVAEHAVPVVLDILSFEDARDLLSLRLGTERVRDEAEVVTELIEHCGRLPLALSIVAARAALNPGFRLTAIAEEIRARDAGLAAFDSRDETISPRAVFAWSYRALSPEAAALFRALSVNPGPDVSLSAAASLAGLPPNETRTLLFDLCETGLLTESQPGRYAFHDLLRAYSRELGEAQDPPDVRAASLERLLNWGIHSADAAADALNPDRQRDDLGEPLSNVTPVEPSKLDAVLEWFDTEHAGLVAIVQLALERGHHREVVDLHWAIVSYFMWRGHRHSGLIVNKAAIEAARRLGDRARQARAHRHLARIYVRMRQFDAAKELLVGALDLFSGETDPVPLGELHNSLGVLYDRQGDYAEALSHTLKALELYRADDYLAGVAIALNNIGWYRAHLGNVALGLSNLQEALDLHVRLGQSHDRAVTLDSLGCVYAMLGDYSQAVSCLCEAIAAFRALGHQNETADSLTRLAGIHDAAGDVDAARAAYREALDILDDIDHPDTDKIRDKLHELESTYMP